MQNIAHILLLCLGLAVCGWMDGGLSLSRTLWDPFESQGIMDTCK